jgi:hypothetical protein
MDGRSSLCMGLSTINDHNHEFGSEPYNMMSSRAP